MKTFNILIVDNPPSTYRNPNLTKFHEEVQSEIQLSHSNEARAFAKAKQLSITQSVLGGDQRRLVVFTDGPGIIMVPSSEDMQIRIFEVDPVPTEEVINTNGAGDGFASGFLVSYLLEGNLVKAVKRGKKATCCIIRRLGFFPFSQEMLDDSPSYIFMV
ncbi:hypothetical protein ACTXT7_005443 [Hymenolepis weldensis]